jgi:hypothetical protein
LTCFFVVMSANSSGFTECATAVYRKWCSSPIGFASCGFTVVHDRLRDFKLTPGAGTLTPGDLTKPTLKPMAKYSPDRTVFPAGRLRRSRLPIGRKRRTRLCFGNGIQIQLHGERSIPSV